MPDKDPTKLDEVAAAAPLLSETQTESEPQEQEGSARPSQLRRVTAALADGAQPRQIGPYRILEPLGAGGMGEVYKAEQRSPIRRTVAVKLIKLGFDSKEVIARFE